MSVFRYPDSPQCAVGAIVIREDKILLVKRGKHPGKGLWAIPGGRIELGETLQQAAEREIKEETGIIIQAKDPVYSFDVIHRDDQGRIRFHYVIVDLSADYVSGKLTPSSDAYDARWITARELDKFPVSRTTRKVLKEVIRFSS